MPDQQPDDQPDDAPVEMFGIVWGTVIDRFRVAPQRLLGKAVLGRHGADRVRPDTALAGAVGVVPGPDAIEWVQVGW